MDDGVDSVLTTTTTTTRMVACFLVHVVYVLNILRAGSHFVERAGLEVYQEVILAQKTKDPVESALYTGSIPGVRITGSGVARNQSYEVDDCLIDRSLDYPTDDFAVELGFLVLVDPHLDLIPRFGDFIG